MKFEVTEEIFYCHDKYREESDGLLLASFGNYLGPVQRRLHLLLIVARFTQRLVRWEDRVLTFQVASILLLITVFFLVLGLVNVHLPWGAILEWTLRLIGAAILGPHMYFLGKRYRARQAAFKARSKAFDEADNATRRSTLDEIREELRVAARKRLDAAVQGVETALLDEMTDGDEGRLPSSSYHPLLVEPRPAAHSGMLRFTFDLDKGRSVAYPMFPSEDRPEPDLSA